MTVDDDLLEAAVERKSVLALLAEDPRHRSELEQQCDISKSTAHRIIRSFDEKGLLRRTEQGYSLTEFGEVVEEQVRAFESTVQTASELRPLLDALQSTTFDVDLELFSDASITRPQPEDPSRPVHRYLELFRQASTIRTIDRTSFIPPLYVEEIFESAMDSDSFSGIAIYPEAVIKDRYAEYTDLHRDVADQAIPIRYRVYESCPIGMSIYDQDHVGLRVYDDETGTLVLFADTDDHRAVAWAEEVFDHYYDRSDPVSTVEGIPDWIPSSEIELEHS